MENIYLVSFPRSGQHYTQRLFGRLTGADDYCELYRCRDPECPGRNLPVHQRTPCRAGRRIQKSHDFNLDFPITTDSRYVVLLRRPLYSLISYFEHSVRNKPERDTADAWAHFAVEKASYWRKFVVRWCTEAEERDNVSTFDYERIISDRASIKRLCDFALDTFDVDRLNHLAHKQVRAVEAGRPSERRLEAFPHPVDADAVRGAIGCDALALAGYDDIT